MVVHSINICWVVYSGNWLFSMFVLHAHTHTGAVKTGTKLNWYDPMINQNFISWKLTYQLYEIFLRAVLSKMSCYYITHNLSYSSPFFNVRATHWFNGILSSHKYKGFPIYLCWFFSKFRRNFSCGANTLTFSEKNSRTGGNDPVWPLQTLTKRVHGLNLTLSFKKNVRYRQHLHPCTEVQTSAVITGPQTKQHEICTLASHGNWSLLFCFQRKLAQIYEIMLLCEPLTNCVRQLSFFSCLIMK